MKRKDFLFILLIFLVWRTSLCLVALFPFLNLQLQNNFLGGGLTNYLREPFLWSWANFDGEHYLSIAQNGYKPLQYFFFPVYPLLIKFTTLLIGNSIYSYLYSGLIVSHLSLFVGLFGLIKLMEIDYNKKLTYLTAFLILIFPTSFYFGSFYTESIFFALSVWSFYFARKGKWIHAVILGSFLPITRIVGLALLPALFIELLEQNKYKFKAINYSNIFTLLLLPVGILSYMVYLNKVTGDPLDFLHNVGIYGQQRSSQLIMLPQVFYRYIFKILPGINYDYFPVVFSTWLEYLSAVIFAILLTFGVLGWLVSHNKLSKYKALRRFKNYDMRESYLVFFALAYLIPTLSGSFSSFSRYVLIMFPGFILLSKWLILRSRGVKYAFIIISLILLTLAASLFIKGYWVA